MNQGAKVLLGGLALVGIGLFVFASGEKQAHAAGGGPPVQPPLIPPLPGTPIIPPQGGVVVVPPFPTAPVGPAGPEPSPTAPAPEVAPFPGAPAPGSTVNIPGFGPQVVPSIPGINAPASSTPGIVPSSLPPVFPTAPVPAPTQVLPGLTVTPGPAPPPAAPPASPAEDVSSAPADTIAAVTQMLANEANPHWRVIPDPALIPWQKARGLTADGDFGTGSALKMAQEIGTIPIIRGWPRGSFLGDGKLEAYRASLVQIANAAPEPRKSQLMHATVREQGQGYGTPEHPIANLITLQDA